MIGARRWTLLGLWLVAGCLHDPAAPLTLQPIRVSQRGEYDRILRRWTRNDTVYDGLDSKAFVHATLFAPEFEAAFRARFGDVFGPTLHQAGLPVVRPTGDAGAAFFLSVATSSPPWNDFDRDNSIWRITLTADEHPPVLATVKRVKLNANVRVVYPYITDWARTYVVRFPHSDEGGRPLISGDTRRLVLRLTSAIGEAKMEWRLKPSEDPIPVVLPAATSSVSVAAAAAAQDGEPPPP